LFIRQKIKKNQKFEIFLDKIYYYQRAITATPTPLMTAQLTLEQLRVKYQDLQDEMISILKNDLNIINHLRAKVNKLESENNQLKLVPTIKSILAPTSKKSKKPKKSKKKKPAHSTARAKTAFQIQQDQKQATKEYQKLYYKQNKEKLIKQRFEYYKNMCFKNRSETQLDMEQWYKKNSSQFHINYKKYNATKVSKERYQRKFEGLFNMKMDLFD
tara:strand:- start:39 stop:683 length:645 start_codon:yes stop_codon:yes gene_type:complete